MINNYFFINFIIPFIIGFLGSNYNNVLTNSTDITYQSPIEKLEKSNNKKVTQKENETLKPFRDEVKQESMRDIGNEVAGKEESVLVYTIQTGSFVTLERSRKKFDSIIQGLFKKNLIILE